MKLPPELPKNQNAAFTLIELLVVITIIAILAGLIMPVMGMVQRSSSRSVTASNFRQLAAGIASYTSENDGELPGPLLSGQGPRYSKTLTGTFGYHLWSYLGATEPGTEILQLKVLTNPAYERINPLPRAAYYLNQDINLAEPGTIRPFGRTTDSGGYIAPLRLANLGAYKLAQCYVLQDVDKLNGPTSASWYSELPEKPYHGDVRMTLFFDWHVEAVTLARQAELTGSDTVIQ